MSLLSMDVHFGSLFEMYGFEYAYDGVYGGQPFFAYRSQGKDFRHREWYVGKDQYQ